MHLAVHRVAGDEDGTRVCYSAIDDCVQFDVSHKYVMGTTAVVIGTTAVVL